MKKTFQEYMNEYESERRRLEEYLATDFPDATVPYLLMNKDYPQPSNDHLPEGILNGTNETAESIRRVLTNSKEIEDLEIELWPEQLASFDAGLPVLLRPNTFNLINQLDSGGQMKSAFENAIGVALSITVYRAVEAVMHLLDIRDAPDYPTLTEKRTMVAQTLSDQWPKDDFRDGYIDKRAAHLDSRWEYGRKAWKQFYAVKDLATTTKAKAYALKGADKASIVREIEFYNSQVLALLHCASSSKASRQKIGEIGKRVSSGRVETASQRANLVGTTARRARNYADVLQAAFAGDLNPAHIFCNLGAYDEYFDTLRLIGRLHRGQLASFESNHVLILAKRIETLKRWDDKPWDGETPQEKVDAFWAQAMKSVMPHDDWVMFVKNGLIETKDGTNLEIENSLE